MGYLTYYSINKVQGTERVWKQFKKKLVALGRGPDSAEEVEEGFQAKWYDWDKDMTDRSRKYPSLIVEIRGDGENSDDLWKARFKAGRQEFIQLATDNRPFLVLRTKAERENHLITPCGALLDYYREKLLYLVQRSGCKHPFIAGAKTLRLEGKTLCSTVYALDGDRKSVAVEHVTAYKDGHLECKSAEGHLFEPRFVEDLEALYLQAAQQTLEGK